MNLFKIKTGILIHHQEKYYLLNDDWDHLINRNSLFDFLKSRLKKTDVISDSEANKLLDTELMPPAGNQEVWAAGVTYLRSRDARMDESADSGAADLYDLVYHASRPELFFKSPAYRLAAHGRKVYIRRDSEWNVPEPELTLFINSEGHIQGYSIGNDMSSRSIEGENALYLPQAKIYDRSAALGPCLFVTENEISPDTVIQMSITRNDELVYRDGAPISKNEAKF